MKPWWFIFWWGVFMAGAEVAPAADATRPLMLLIAGQSREEFTEYWQEVSVRGAAGPVPGGAAFYTSLDLNGVRRPHANAPGDHYQDLPYLTLMAEPLVIQVGLWLSRDQLFEIVAGQRDLSINALRDELARLERPVFVRIGYEFDGPHNRYPPEVFVEAYRVIARALRSCPDLLLVWHSFAMVPTYQEHPLSAWYPGDEYVDWIGVSFFQVGAEGYHRDANREEVLAIARARGKPVLVAEASAIRYTVRQKTLTGADYWEYWYAPFFEFVESHPEIRAVSIINVNWDAQSQHRVLDWGDARINADPVVLERWREKSRATYWLPADDRLYDAVRRLGAELKPSPVVASPTDLLK